MLLAKPYRDLNPARADEDYRVKLPLSPVWHAKQIHHVTTAEGVAALTRFIDERPISHIGFDTEFCFEKPPFEHGDKKMPPQQNLWVVIGSGSSPSC